MSAPAPTQVELVWNGHFECAATLSKTQSMRQDIDLQVTFDLAP